MSEQIWDPVSRKFVSPGVGGNTTQRGVLAGQDARFNELERAQLMQQFLQERGWGGIAGASKRPKGPALETQFNDWLSARKPKTMPNPAASPSPSPSPMASPSPRPTVVGSFQDELSNYLQGQG